MSDAIQGHHEGQIAAELERLRERVTELEEELNATGKLCDTAQEMGRKVLDRAERYGATIDAHQEELGRLRAENARLSETVNTLRTGSRAVTEMFSEVMRHLCRAFAPDEADEGVAGEQALEVLAELPEILERGKRLTEEAGTRIATLTAERDAAVASEAAMREALQSLWAATGDRLLARGPLSKEYAHGVSEEIGRVLATPASAHLEKLKADAGRERAMEVLKMLRLDLLHRHRCGAESTLQDRMASADAYEEAANIVALRADEIAKGGGRVAMHECPDCGQACDCDDEDMWYDEAPPDCFCECEGFDEDGDYDGEDREG